MKTKLKTAIIGQFSKKQRALILKYGTPAEFASVCYACVPSDISMDEAAAAVENYRQEFDEAK